MGEIKLVISVKDIIGNLYIDSYTDKNLSEFISKLGITVSELYYESERIVSHEQLKRSYLNTRKVLDEHFGVSSDEKNGLSWYFRKNT